MADQDTSLPIRSEKDGSDSRVHVKIVDYSSPDGANAQAEVSDGNVHTYVHGKDPGAVERLLRLSEQGATAVDGAYDAVNNTVPSSTGLIALTRNASPAVSQQSMRLTAKDNVAGDVRALDVAIRDASGEAFSSLNPIPVSVVSAVTGTAILDYVTAASVAKAATSTHTYTVGVGKILVLQKIQAAASGKIKVEIKMGAAGSEVTKIVLFNSTANPSVEYMFSNPQQHAAASNVLVVITNLDLQAQDVYSTLEGYEI